MHMLLFFDTLLCKQACLLGSDQSIIAIIQKLTVYSTAQLPKHCIYQWQKLT